MTRYLVRSRREACGSGHVARHGAKSACRFVQNCPPPSRRHRFKASCNGYDWTKCKVNLVKLLLRARHTAHATRRVDNADACYYFDDDDDCCYYYHYTYYFDDDYNCC